MNYFKRIAALAVAILCAFGITANAGQNLPYINVALQQTVSGKLDAKAAEAQRKLSVKKLAREVTKHPFVDKTAIPQVEERLGLPTFVFVTEDVPVLKVGNLSRDMQSKSEFAAKTYLAQFADLYKLNKQTLSGAKTTHVHDIGSGPVIVKFQQYVDGIEVFLHNMQLMMQRDSKLTAISGYLSPHVAKMESAGEDSFELQKQQVLDFQLDAVDAIMAAFENLGGIMNYGDLTHVETKGSYDFYKAYEQEDSPYTLQQNARTKKVLFSLADGLVPGYYVELKAGPMGDKVNFDYYSFVISAQSGKVLFRNNLVSHADNNNTGVEWTYKVYADADGFPYDSPRGNAGTPYMTRDNGKPNFVSQRDITLEYHSSLSTKDPWLAHNATKTSGNNVDAYADLEAGDNYQSGGLDTYGVPNSPLAFDYTYGDADDSGDITSDTYIQAAVVNLFYVHNFLHDWYYDAGFNEAAGNAQLSNYGRGGEEGDPMLAEAMDYGGTNNANMATPADGTSPQTQMYLWTAGDTTLTFLDASDDTTNDALQQQRAGTSVGNFGPSTYDVTAEVVEVTLNSSRTTFCDADDTPDTVDLNGKIALVNRGGCAFTEKTMNAQNANADGIIIVSTVVTPTDAIQDLAGTDDSVTIPTMLISNFSGQLYDAEKANGTLKARMKVEDVSTKPKRDGTFDNAIIAHEWGHYITNRLIGNGNGLGTPQARGFGEGASDFHALLLSTKESDKQISGNDELQGPYAMGGFTLTDQRYQAYYFGIRRYPYSTQLSINPLTFKYIADENTLPDTPPRSPSNSVNSQVHKTGEVWGSAMWNTYIALQNSGRLDFDEMRDQMKVYLVAGYKMIPNSPTLIETRDAILAAIRSYSSADYAVAKEAFRKRGWGALAIAPSRDSTDHAGTEEDFSATGGALDFVSGSIDQSTGYCDADGVIDEDETFTVSVTLRNSGFMTLTNTTATVSLDSGSDDSVDVTWANGGVIAFDSSEPNEMVTGTVTGTLNTAGRGNTMLIAINYADDTSTDVTGEAPDPLKEWVHFDQGSPNATTDDGEQPYSQWTIDNLVDGGASNWTYYQDLNDLPDSAFATMYGSDATTLKGYSHGYYAVDFGSTSDMTLTSPEVTVDDTGDITMTFDHVYHFEDGSWDGGVLEVSVNDGSWTDITTIGGGNVSPDYDGEFVNNVNPMAVVDGSFRRAWLNTSPDFPSKTSATATLTGLSSGDTVQFRFRAGSDGAAGDFGWYIDDISFTGISNTPFSSITDDSGTCTNRPPVADAGTDQTVASGDSVTLSGSVNDADSGDTLTYQWKQIGGTAVSLTNAAGLSASFTAPTVAQDTVLTFAFYATDGTVAGPSDTVSITVTSTNNPPTVPYLVFPENGSTGVASDLTFKWAKVTDADDDDVSYTLEYCDNALFVNCRSSGSATSSAAAYHSATFTAGIGGGLAAFFLLSLMLLLAFRNKRRGKGMRLIVISMFAVAFTIVMAACSSDEEEETKTKTVTETVTVTEKEMVSASVTGLTSGYTYYWKVTASDSAGASVESMVYTFTVE